MTDFQQDWNLKLSNLECNGFTCCSTVAALTILVYKQGFPQGKQEVVYGLGAQTRCWKNENIFNSTYSKNSSSSIDLKFR